MNNKRDRVCTASLQPDSASSLTWLQQGAVYATGMFSHSMRRIEPAAYAFSENANRFETEGRAHKASWGMIDGLVQPSQARPATSGSIDPELISSLLLFSPANRCDRAAISERWAFSGWLVGLGTEVRGLLAAHWAVGLVLAIVISLFLIAIEDAANAPVLRGSALVLLLIGLIATKDVQDHVAALIFFATAITVASIPPKVALSGFSAGATWLIYAGAILAAALGEVGLSGRIAHGILRRTGASYGSLIAAIIGLSLLLAILIPSTTGRILLLLPIIMALAPRIGLAAGSRGYCGLIIAAVCGSYLPLAGILTSSNRNVAFAGSANALYGTEFGFSDYLIWNFPVLTACISLALLILVTGRYRERIDAVSDPEEAPGLLNRSQRCVLLVMFGALCLWATDFLHHISPAWIGLAAAILCIVGPCRALAAPERMAFAPLVMFAALIGLGATMAHSGLSERLGETLVELFALRPDPSTAGTVWNLIAITVIGLLVSIIGTNLAGPVVLATLAQPIAAATAWPVSSVLITMMPSMSICTVVFQSPIVLVAMRMAGVPLREISLFLLLMTAVMASALLPAQFLWLAFLGIVP